ncbi:hypothetical protein BDV19DRAFT_371361 [Aspergillus venezuelensis]
MSTLLSAVMECIVGTSTSTSLTRATATHTKNDDQIVSDIITAILNAQDAYSLHKELSAKITTTSWTENIAKATLNGLTKAITTGAKMARAASDAMDKAEEAAVGFATEHPVYATLIALGILAILTPFVLEILGFGELGPIEGSFAAVWQSRWYGGEVPKRALFGYFQRLGMKWRWFG